MENERMNSKFPFPPTYYKDFETPESMKPPDSKIISKMNTFKTFGVEYKTKHINIFLKPVEINKFREEDIKKYHLKNMDYFQNLYNMLEEKEILISFFHFPFIFLFKFINF